MKKNLQKGFTLIELLVVVAIIGILASVVLGSLNSARNKGNDAAIKANLSGVRSSAEIFYDNNSNRYNTNGTTAATGHDCATTLANTMFADPNILAALGQSKTQNGGTALYCNMNAAGSAYAIAVPLKTSGQWWCIDSTGASKGTQGTGTTGYTALSGAGTAALADNADLTCN